MRLGNPVPTGPAGHSLAHPFGGANGESNRAKVGHTAAATGRVGLPADRTTIIARFFGMLPPAVAGSPHRSREEIARSPPSGVGSPPVSGEARPVRHMMPPVAYRCRQSEGREFRAKDMIEA